MEDSWHPTPDERLDVSFLQDTYAAWPTNLLLLLGNYIEHFGIRIPYGISVGSDRKIEALTTSFYQHEAVDKHHWNRGDHALFTLKIRAEIRRILEEYGWNTDGRLRESVGAEDGKWEHPKQWQYVSIPTSGVVTTNGLAPILPMALDSNGTLVNLPPISTTLHQAFSARESNSSTPYSDQAVVNLPTISTTSELDQLLSAREVIFTPQPDQPLVSLPSIHKPTESDQVSSVRQVIPADQTLQPSTWPTPPPEESLSSIYETFSTQDKVDLVAQFYQSVDTDAQYKILRALPTPPPKRTSSSPYENLSPSDKHDLIVQLYWSVDANTKYKILKTQLQTARLLLPAAKLQLLLKIWRSADEDDQWKMVRRQFASAKNLDGILHEIRIHCRENFPREAHEMLGRKSYENPNAGTSISRCSTVVAVSEPGSPNHEIDIPEELQNIITNETALEERGNSEDNGEYELNDIPAFLSKEHDEHTEKPTEDITNTTCIQQSLQTMITTMFEKLPSTFAEGIMETITQKLFASGVIDSQAYEVVFPVPGGRDSTINYVEIRRSLEAAANDLETTWSQEDLDMVIMDEDNVSINRLPEGKEELSTLQLHAPETLYSQEDCGLAPMTRDDGLSCNMEDSQLLTSSATHATDTSCLQGNLDLTVISTSNSSEELPQSLSFGPEDNAPDSACLLDEANLVPVTTDTKPVVEPLPKVEKPKLLDLKTMIENRRRQSKEKRAIEEETQRQKTSKRRKRCSDILFS